MWSFHLFPLSFDLVSYAALFEADIRRLDLRDLPRTHRDGPYLLNVQRSLDMPQAVAMAAEKSPIVIGQADTGGWDYPSAVVQQLGWDNQRLQIQQRE